MIDASGATTPIVDLAGVFVPAVTPFDPDSGNLDVVAFRSNLRHWLASDIRGVVVAGTSGESVLLSNHERRLAVEAARDLVPASSLLIAGTGGESTRATIAMTREAASAGADAVLVQPPSFFKAALSDLALADHYRAVADQSPVPVILYRVPASCNTVELGTGLVSELSHHENIVGIKDSRGDLSALGEYVSHASKDFQVLVGSGSKLYPALEIGAVGGILGVANIAAADAVELYAEFSAGRTGRAVRLQARIGPIHDGIVARRGIPGMKTALDLLGLHGGRPRPPLRPCSETDVKEIEEVLKSAGFLDTPEASA